MQLVEQIRLGAASGALEAGAELPSIRPLAKSLHIHHHTVAKAYSVLQRLELVRIIPGKGAFVSRPDSSLSHRARQQLVTRRIDDAIATAYQAQMDPTTIVAMLQERLAHFGKHRTATEATKEGSQAKQVGKEQGGILGGRGSTKGSKEPARTRGKGQSTSHRTAAKSGSHLSHLSQASPGAQTPLAEGGSDSPTQLSGPSSWGPAVD